MGWQCPWTVFNSWNLHRLYIASLIWTLSTSRLSICLYKLRKSNKDRNHISYLGMSYCFSVHHMHQRIANWGHKKGKVIRNCWHWGRPEMASAQIREFFFVFLCTFGHLLAGWESAIASSSKRQPFWEDNHRGYWHISISSEKLGSTPFIPCPPGWLFLHILSKSILHKTTCHTRLHAHHFLNANLNQKLSCICRWETRALL